MTGSLSPESGRIDRGDKARHALYPPVDYRYMVVRLFLDIPHIQPYFGPIGRQDWPLPSELRDVGAAHGGSGSRDQFRQATKARSPMSTPAPAPPPPPASAHPVPPTAGTSDQEIRIISHSNLFYWWPVWAVGFLMALLTAIDGRRMILVPGADDVDVRRDWTIVTGPGALATDPPKTELREGVLLQKGNLLPDKPEKAGEKLAKPLAPKLHMAANSSYGVVWAAVLLLVIFITNVPLRGLWSVVVIVFVVLIAVIFALADWWTTILSWLYVLDIRVNMGGYLFISIILFTMWLIVTWFFDRQIYMIFTPGQLKVCTEIGGGEAVYDVQGMSVEKHRDDLFRHWILGLGSGDLTVKTSGANQQTFNLHNVLFIGRKLQLIEEMQRDRPVVKG